MKTAAMECGLKPEIVIPGDDRFPLVAFISLKKGAITKPLLTGYLWKRNTNRKLFKKTPLKDEIYEDMKGSISKFQGVKIHFVKDRSNLEKLSKIVYKADLIRNQIKSVHEHLHGKIRYSWREAEEKRDGFPVKNLEAGFWGEKVLKATKSWDVMNFANRFGLHRVIAGVSQKGVLSSGGAALITAEDFKMKSFVKGGQAMERIWLELARRGISFQPVTAVTLFLNRLKFEGDIGFNSNHRKILEDIISEYNMLFPGVDIDKHGQIMLFRMGYGKAIDVNTLRKKISDFMTE